MLFGSTIFICKEFGRFVRLFNPSSAVLLPTEARSNKPIINSARIILSFRLKLGNKKNIIG